MEQKPPAHDPALAALNTASAAYLRALATSDAEAPAARFARLLAAHGLNDDAAAGLLQVARPTVTRTRLGDRPPSFDVAARIQALLGIPAVDWLEVPAILTSHANALSAAANERGKANKPRPRKAA